MRDALKRRGSEMAASNRGKKGRPDFLQEMRCIKRAHPAHKCHQLKKGTEEAMDIVLFGNYIFNFLHP
jgi:hypothetical protein